MDEELEERARQWVVDRKRFIAARSRLFREEGACLLLKQSMIDPDCLDEPLRSAVLSLQSININGHEIAATLKSWRLTAPEIKVTWDKVVGGREE